LLPGAATTPAQTPTQLSVQDGPRSARDSLDGLLSADEQAAVTLPFRSEAPGPGYLSAHRDIVIA
jgi:hypothetical protein